jgi:hypothetical protein
MFMPKARPLSLTELNALLPRIQATVEMLVGSARQSRGAEPTPKARVGTRTRAGAARIQERLLSTLKGAKSGLSLGQIVKRSGAERTAVKYHLRRLRAQKKARVVGDRKLARWFAGK